MNLLIKRHCVPPGTENPFFETVAGAHTCLTDFQFRLLKDPSPIRIASAPTGAGKTYAFELAPLIGLNILLVVPTRRLAQNLEQSVRDLMNKNGWNEADVDARLSVWTSDAMEVATQSGQTPSEVRSNRVRQLRGQGGFRKHGTFIIATPESIGHLLLNPPPGDHGQPAMSLQDLLSRDHIVFDEFHTIKERGFGLACALCRIAGALSEAGHQPHITFLSATPIDIGSTLAGFDIDKDKISLFEEQIESWPPDQEPKGARVVHGDVTLSLGAYGTLVEAIKNENDAIMTALENGQSIVVIYDSVERLKAERRDLSEIFRSHGLNAEDILTINSIDDFHRLLQDEHGLLGSSVDPRQTRVILATSSIEMGVTFDASLMFMEEGYGPCSFIQRVGRVSRGDLSGRVVVAGFKPGKLKKFRKLAENLSQQENHTIEVCVREFTTTVLSDVVGGFSGKSIAEDGSLPTHGILSTQAVWCACLFWAALRRVWSIHAGERTTLWHFQPRKVGVFEAKLKELEKCDLEQPKHWVKEFLHEATRFRDIETRIRVCHGTRIDHVPESLVGRFQDISGGTILEDQEGIYIKLRRPLEAILATNDTRPFKAKIQPLMPLDGMMLGPVSRKNAVKEIVDVLKRTQRHPFGKKGDQVLNTVIDLIRMTGVFPQEGDEEITSTHHGSAVL